MTRIQNPPATPDATTSLAIDHLSVPAVRYALGRMTYIVYDVVETLLAHRHALTDTSRIAIIRDIEIAFIEERAGMDMDVQQWRRLRDALIIAHAVKVPPKRNPRVDWTAIEHLVDAAIKRQDISTTRGAEILGLTIRAWRNRANEIKAEENPTGAKPQHLPYKGLLHALKDLTAILPPNRWALLRPETQATIDQVLTTQEEPK